MCVYNLMLNRRQCLCTRFRSINIIVTIYIYASRVFNDTRRLFTPRSTYKSISIFFYSYFLPVPSRLRVLCCAVGFQSILSIWFIRFSYLFSSRTLACRAPLKSRYFQSRFRFSFFFLFIHIVSSRNALPVPTKTFTVISRRKLFLWLFILT